MNDYRMGCAFQLALKLEDMKRQNDLSFADTDTGLILLNKKERMTRELFGSQKVRKGPDVEASAETMRGFEDAASVSIHKGIGSSGSPRAAGRLE